MCVAPALAKAAARGKALHISSGAKTLEITEMITTKHSDRGTLANDSIECRLLVK